MPRLVRLILALMLLVGPAAGFTPVSAQQETRTVSIATVDIETGESITTACYVFVNFSQQGCDENGDGFIRFQGMPLRDFVVTQTIRAPGYLPMGDFPVTIHDQGNDQIIHVELARADGVERGPFDISIAPFDTRASTPIQGGCFILHGGSLEGCDENRDGRIDFRGVPAGAYLLSQTEPAPGYLLRADSWIDVSANGLIRVDLVAHTAPPASDLVDVSIVTRAGDGALLLGACYIIVNASIEGCDENGDGQVDYRDVRPGVYTVTQTLTPGNFDPLDDFTITITNEPTQVFVVNQAGWGPESTIVSLIAVDALTGERITSAATCFIVLGGSLEGCDRNEDGQVDYLGIRAGRYAVEITSAPVGYLPYDVPLEIQVLAVGDHQFFWIPFAPRRG